MIELQNFDSFLIKHNILKEMSQLIDKFDKLTDKEIEEYFTNLYNKEKSNLAHIQGNLYKLFIANGEEVIYDIEKENIQGVVYFESDGFKIANKQFFSYIPHMTKKFKYNITKGMMLNIYSSYSKLKHNGYIMSDSKQTINSKEVWKKWYNNPNKYKIKEIFCLDLKANQIVEFKDIEDSWGTSKEYQRYRITAKF